MESITITLNGREVSGYSGMTVLELARESGFDIPTLCHDENLAAYGACRLCIVEEERTGALLASCVTPIAPGMTINTASPRVLERRSMIVRLMLASHPQSCLVCDKGNRCELRQIAADLGIGEAGLERVQRATLIQDVNPFMERDLSRCIMCAKCIRVDHELVVEGAIDYVDRGFASRPATLSDSPLEVSACTFCGSCMAACPTGALMETNRTYGGSTSRSVDTVCPMCGCGCEISVETKGNLIVRSRPAKKAKINRGTLCVKGCHGLEFVHSPDRLKHPLVKEGEGFREATWSEAIGLAAAGLQRIAAQKGPESLAVLGSTKCTNEENYILQRFARSVLGTNNIDNGSRLSSASSRMGFGWTLGTPGSTAHLGHLEQADLILCVGADPTSSAPVVGYAIKRAAKYRNATLITVDPRKTKLTPFARFWLRPRPGTDAVLIAGMARVIIYEGLLDEEYVSRRTDNYEAFKESLAPYTLAAVQGTTGVDAGDVATVARMFAGAERAAIVCGNGVTQYSSGTDCAMALANLSMLTGNSGFQGGGLYALQRDCNGQGAADMGTLPGFLPGYQSVQDPQVRAAFEKVWGGSLPGEVGLTALEMVLMAGEGVIKGMYVVGENPALSFPDVGSVKKDLQALEMLVVQDVFLTETARLAHVVLPAASFAEKEGTFTNFEGRIQSLKKVVEPPGKCLPDSTIIMQMAAAMDRPMDYSSIAQVDDEIATMVPLYEEIGHPDHEGGSIYRLNETGEMGMRRLRKGQFPSAFDRFHPVEFDSEFSLADNGFPLTLLAGSSLFRAGTGSTSSHSRRLSAIESEPYVEMPEAVAAAHEIGDGDMVKVLSAAGEVSARARIVNTLTDGMVFMPVSFPASPANSLFSIVLDSRSMTPSLKACQVRLERI